LTNKNTRPNEYVVSNQVFLCRAVKSMQSAQ
jgi:hypothetical protein